jgi:hypothetical protein
VTAAVLDRPTIGRTPVRRPGGSPAGEAPSPGGTLEAPSPGGTLEALLTGALHRVHANGSTECPVCHGTMTSTRAGAREASLAECGGCGSRLS